jgi:aspartokinase
MANLTHEVWIFLDSEPSIKKELGRGIVNVMALAKHILKAKNLDCSVDAVISAIRRYVTEKKFHTKYQNAEKIIKSSRISTKNKIALITMKRDSQIIELLPKVFPLIELSRGDVMRLSEGKESIKLLVDEKNLQKILDIFPSSKVVGAKKNLSEINIHFGPGSGESVGVLATIMNELAANDIGITESIGCLPEFMIFVDTKDALKAYEAMMNLAEY